MQTDGSVVVSELAVVVLAHALSLAQQCFHLAVSWSPTYIQHKQHTPLYAFRLPFMFRSVITKTTRATTERGSDELAVRNTHHTS